MTADKIARRRSRANPSHAARSASEPPENPSSAVVPRVRLSARRRTCVTDLLEADVPVEVVAEIIGHQGLENLKAYSRVRAERLKPAMEGRWYGRRDAASADLEVAVEEICRWVLAIWS